MKLSIKERYEIKKVSYHFAMDIVIKNHYLHRKCPCSFAFGLFEKSTGECFGVIVYGTPSSSRLREGICGIEEKFNVIELTRLWIKDNTEKNLESFLIGNTIKLVDKEIIVSFAEPQHGHLGIVYQATNWIYTGLSAKRTNWHVEGLAPIHNHSLVDKFSSKELKEKYRDAFKLVDRPRKHRYIYFNASKNRKKALISKLKYSPLPYPKNATI